MADIDTIIANARAYADGAVASAHSFLDTLKEIATIEFQLTPIDIYVPDDYDFVRDALSDIKGAKPDRPDINDIDLPTPATPNISIPEMGNVTVPDFDGSSPSLEYPVRPDSTLPAAPGGPPAVDDVAMPDAPVYSLPDIPAITGVDIPSPPTIQMPTFDAELPVDTVTEDEITLDYSGDDAVTDLHTTMVSRVNDIDADVLSELIDDIRGNGLGLDPDSIDYSRVINRVKDRAVAESQRVADEAGRNIAAMGWPMPQGALNKMVEEAQRRAQEVISDANRDIIQKEIDAHIEIQKYKIDTMLKMSQVYLDFHNKMAGRSLEVAKAVAQVGVEVYNLRIKRLQADLDIYKTEADVFKTKIEAEIAKAQIYREQIEGIRAETDVKRLMVQVYVSQIDAINSMINMYKTDMQAAAIKVDVEKTKLDAYRSEVQAYVEQVRAKEAEFKAYEAGISGEVAKVKAYEAETRAYESEVSGAKLKADIELSKVRSRIDETRAEIDVYNLQMEEWKARYETAVANIQRVVEMYKADLGGFASEASAIANIAGLGVESARAYDSTNIQATKLAIDNAKLQLDSLVSAANLRVEASGAGAEVYKNLAAAALSAVNTLSAITEQIESQQT